MEIPNCIHENRSVKEYKAMRILYSSLILPYFSYWNEVWGKTYLSDIKPLFVLQKRAVRIIHDVDFREHTDGMFIKSGLLKLKELIELQTLLWGKMQNIAWQLTEVVCVSEDEDHRQKLSFKHQFVRTHLKQISVVGV